MSERTFQQSMDRAEIALIAETGMSAEEINQAKAHCVCGNYVADHGFYDGHYALSMWDHQLMCRAEDMDKAELDV